MAIPNFYVQSGGADNNSGSTTSNSAAQSTTNGNWDGTSVFTAASGTPFSGTSIGDWASIYVDGSTVTGYVAQVTAINGGGSGITVSTTQKIGTAPTSSATARSAKVGGAHASEQPWANFGATTTLNDTIVNWKQATYTVTASRTFAVNGPTNDGHIWFRGYNTTPGDLETNPTLARPVLACNSTFALTMSGANQLWSGFSITGNRTGLVATFTGNGTYQLRVKIENTSTNAAAVAVTLATANQQAFYCWYKTPTTATTTGTCNVAVLSNLIGCIAEGGGVAGFNCGGSDVTLLNCLCINNTGVGVLASTGRIRVLYCTIYNSTSDGVKWTGAPVVGCAVIGTIFSVIGGFGINNSVGTTCTFIVRMLNDYHSMTSGQENGFAQDPAFFVQTESSSPFISAGTNFGILSSSSAKANGSAPGGYENFSSTVSYEAIGAIEPQSTGTSFVPQVME
jgi:hypothetical protein